MRMTDWVVVMVDDVHDRAGNDGRAADVRLSCCNSILVGVMSLEEFLAALRRVNPRKEPHLTLEQTPARLTAE